MTNDKKSDSLEDVNPQSNKQAIVSEVEESSEGKTNYIERDISIIDSPPDTNDKHQLREWWHEILRDYGRYSCYAVFLVLPSDKEVFHYLNRHGKELNVISGENCLVIILSEGRFRRFDFTEEVWETVLEEHFTEALSVVRQNIV